MKKNKKKADITHTPMSNSTTFLKFLKAYNLNTKDEDFLIKIQHIVNEVTQEVKQYKNQNAVFKLLYILKVIPISYNKQIKRLLNEHDQIISNVLVYCKEKGFILEINNLRDEVILINEVLNHAGNSKASKFYTLNYSSNEICSNLKLIPDYVDNDFKEIVIDEKNDYEKRKNEWLEIKENKRFQKEHKNKTILDKVREALISLINKEISPKQLFDYLHHGKGLVSSKSKWLGKKIGETYEGGLFNYMISYGYLKEIVDETNLTKIKIMPKVDRNYTETEEIVDDKLINKELGIAFDFKINEGEIK